MDSRVMVWGILIGWFLMDTGFGSPARYISPRMDAMGGALLPFAEDAASALTLNPAHIGKFKRKEFEIFNGVIRASDGLLQSLHTNTQVMRLESLKKNLSEIRPQMAAMGLSLFPNFGVSGFSIGLLINMDQVAQQDPFNNIHAYALTQCVPMIGFGTRFLKGAVRVGYSLQWVNKQVSDQTIPRDMPQSFMQNAVVGSGFSHAMGIAITLPMKIKPSFQLALRDMGNTYYTSKYFFNRAPSGVPKDPMGLDGSFSIDAPLGSGVFLLMSVVDQNINKNEFQNFSTSRWIENELSFGAELAFSSIFFMRLGYAAQKGGSGGLGLYYHKQSLSLSLSQQSSLVSGIESIYSFQYTVRLY